MARITIDIPDELAASLKAQAVAEGIAEGDLVLEALSWRVEAFPAWDPYSPDAERLARIATGKAELKAGLGVPHERVLAWIEELDAGGNPPPPV